MLHNSFIRFIEGQICVTNLRCIMYHNNFALSAKNIGVSSQGFFIDHSKKLVEWVVVCSTPDGFID